MDAFSTILHASLTGSVNFLTFIAGGAAIAHLGHWGTTISTNLAACKQFPIFLHPVLAKRLNTQETFSCLNDLKERWLTFVFVNDTSFRVSFPHPLILSLPLQPYLRSFYQRFSSVLFSRLHTTHESKQLRALLAPHLSKKS